MSDLTVSSLSSADHAAAQKVATQPPQPPASPQKSGPPIIPQAEIIPTAAGQQPGSSASAVQIVA